MNRRNQRGNKRSRRKVECVRGRETEEDNRRGHPGSHLIVHPLTAVQMGRLTPVSSFNSSYNGPQLRWAVRERAILSKVTQFLGSVLSFQPLSAHEGGEQILCSYITVIVYTDRFTNPQSTLEGELWRDWLTLW